MGSYKVNLIKNGDRATFETENLSYTDRLNLTDEAVVNIPGSSQASRDFVSIGTEVEIQRNGNIEFYGDVIGVSFLDAGGISLRCKDFTFQGATKKALKKTYPSTASATIFTEQINNWNSSYLGTIATGVNLDFQADSGNSTLNILSNLRKKTDQDIEKVYSTKKINVVDHKGSSTSVLTLNDYIDISDLGYDFQQPIGNVITVYGKGTGQNQIISESTSGQNASSISTYGEIEKTERDLTIVSVDEANRLADVLATKYGEVTKSYTFIVNNPSQNLVSGDVITLNSSEKDINAEEVRIVGIKRGLRGGNEFLEMQVTNKEYSELIKSTEKLIGDIQLNNIDQQTYNQDTGNTLTFSGLINATSSAPLRIVGNMPSSYIEDEVGNIRVNSFTLDYDVDPFRSSVGTATEDDVAPDVSGSSSNTAPNVSGTSSTTDIYSNEGSDSAFNESLSSGWNNSVLSETISGTFNFIFVNYKIDADFTDTSIYLAVKINSTNDYIEHFVNLDTTVDDVLVEKTVAIPIFQSTSQTVTMDVFTNSAGQYDLSMTIYGGLLDHSHGDGSYGADSHPHGDGSYGAASHNHNVNVGDDVSDSGSLNATAVDVYIDYWNGSSWVNKHSILGISDLIKEDLDVSNGGTLPDAAGFWRSRIFTNNSNADLIQGTLKVDHNLNTQ